MKGCHPSSQRQGRSNGLSSQLDKVAFLMVLKGSLCSEVV